MIKLANPDFVEEIPVLAIPTGNPNTDHSESANWEIGTLESHGLGVGREQVVSVRDEKYKLKLVDLTAADFDTYDCDNMDGLVPKWARDQEEERKRKEEEAEQREKESKEKGETGREC